MTPRPDVLTAGFVLLLVTAPPALGHGEVPDDAFTPREHRVDTWLTAEGSLSFEAPLSGERPMTLDQGEGAEAAFFTLAVPFGATVQGPAGVLALATTNGPMVPRAADNGLAALQAVVDGEPVGEPLVVAAPEDAPAPERYATPFEMLQTGGAVTAGGKVGLTLTFVGSVPLGDPVLLTGPEGSTARFTVAASSLDDLGHDHGAWRHLPVDDAPDPEGLVLDLELRHDGFTPVEQVAVVGQEVHVRIDNAETEEQAASHGPWGLADPHVVEVRTPALTERVTVYPGEVLLRTFTLAAAGTLTVACVEGCTAEGVARLVIQEAGDASRLVDDVELAGGGLHEVNLEVPAGGTLGYAFTTEPATPLRWNLHTHAGDDVTYLVEETSAAANGTYNAPTTGVYSLLWENPGDAAVTLSYEVSGGVVVEASGSDSFLPAPGLSAAVIVLALAAWRGRPPKES